MPVNRFLTLPILLPMLLGIGLLILLCAGVGVNIFQLLKEGF